MSAESQKLKRRITGVRAEELFEIVAFDAADYRGEALDLARAELHKRGNAFAIGFTCSVVLLLFVVSEVPWYVALITGECLCLWVLIEIVSGLIPQRTTHEE
jgi:hypothetical protein